MSDIIPAIMSRLKRLKCNRPGTAIGRNVSLFRLLSHRFVTTLLASNHPSNSVVMVPIHRCFREAVASRYVPPAHAEVRTPGPERTRHWMVRQAHPPLPID